MPERPDDFERHLAERLHRYEADLPHPTRDPLVAVPSRRPLWIGAAGTLAAAAVVAGVVILAPDSPPTADATPSPSPSTTATASAAVVPSDSLSPTPAASSSASAPASATPEPAATPDATPGPIVRWAVAASFGVEGFAEEVRDVGHGGGHFVAVGYREPLDMRGQVGPPQHDPRVWISPDGSAWEALVLGPEFAGAHLSTIITLPDGAAAIYGSVDRGPDEFNQDIVAVGWRSADGRTWTTFDPVIPEDPEAFEPATIGDIAQGAKGYLAGNYRGEVQEIWLSTDGVRWEVVHRFTNDRPGWVSYLRDFGAGDEGFVVTGESFEVDAEERVYEPIVLASGDGRNWVEPDPEAVPPGPNLLVAAVGGDWIITQTDTEAGTDVTWFSNDGLTWNERAAIDVPDLPDADEYAPGDGVIGRIIEAGDRAFISGAFVVCCHGPWWAAGIWSSIDASSWERLGFPDDAVIDSAATHDGVTVLAGHTGASPDAQWQARATFWVGVRD